VAVRKDGLNFKLTKMKNIILVAVLVLLSFTALSQVRVVDGDTFYHNGTKIRLAYVDAPEKNQPQGQMSKDWLENYLKGKDLKFELVTIDKYGRRVCVVWVNGINLSEKIVEQGYAWNYDYFSKSAYLESLERTARINKKGIWKYENNVEPNVWRKL
jgi:micrococcal nuclease